MEPFSIATGVFQVAGAGFQLAKTLYTFATAIRDAEKDINAIATQVKLTSSVLENLAVVLEKDDGHGIGSHTLRTDAQAAMNGCKSAFDELDAALASAMKNLANPKRVVSFASRAKWPLDKTKMRSLRSNLERLQTTLTLMLSVLNYAISKQSSQTVTQPKGNEEADRLRIERLIKSNEQLYQSFSGIKTHPATERTPTSTDRGIIIEDAL